MRVEEIGLDPRIEKVLAEDGIETLYPPQETAVVPALAGKNVVLAMPTASGKSLVAYLAILQAVLKGGKALYIVPLKALASEKFDDLVKFETLGLKVAVATGDYDTIDPKLSRFDIVIATSEKADSLLRHRVKWLDQISVVVADEIHMINDPERGPTLEVTLAKFKTFNPTAQIIALSATISNSGELAEWLGAELIESDWRPVPLKEGVFAEGEVFFTDNTKRVIATTKNPLHGLVKEALGKGGQVLIFVNTRKAAESLAGELGSVVKEVGGVSNELGDISKRLLGDQEEPTSLGNKLGRSIRTGCAFHHAGLTNPQRRMVETTFKKGVLRCIVATPTLAAGINLPARTVLIRDVKRYDSNVGYTVIPVFEIKQMCGRAGRPRFDSYGEAILLAKDSEEKEFLLETYLLGENERIYSKLGTEPAIRSHVLALIATRAATSPEAIEDFFGKTFLAHQTDVRFLNDTISTVLEFLKKEGMVRDTEPLSATTFGKAVSDLYIDPLSAVAFRDALPKVQPGKAFGILHMICSVPDMPLLYLRQSDYEWIEEYESEKDEQLLIEPPSDLSRYEIFLSEVKTAKLIDDWISEVHENDIANAFRIGPGDIRNKMDMAEWLIHASVRLAELFNREAVDQVTELRTRIEYGIRPELLELVKLRGIGRVRARALHDRGLRSIEDLRTTSYDRLKQIPTIGEAVAKAIKSQLGQSEPGMIIEPEDKQRSLEEYR